MNDSVIPAGPPLLVEVYLDGAYVSGLTRQIDERRRLIDVLNTPTPTFLLESATMTMDSRAYSFKVDAVYLEKKSILAAIPHETQEQIRLRATTRIGLNRSGGPRTQLSVIAPPLRIEGTTQLPIGKGNLHTDPDLFTRFFALAEANFYKADGSCSEVAVVIINRDAVVALSRVTPGLQDAV